MENYAQVRKFKAIVVSCMLFFVALVGVAVVSFVSLGKTRRENARYDELIASLKKEEQSLNADINYISNGETYTDEYLEEKARNELGMIKKGEIFYTFK